MQITLGKHWSASVSKDHHDITYGKTYEACDTFKTQISQWHQHYLLVSHSCRVMDGGKGKCYRALALQNKDKDLGATILGQLEYPTT